MSVRIITDSTADHIPAVLDRCVIVPMTIRFGQEEFIDGVTIHHQQFYEKLTASDQLPATSQPTLDSFAKAYQSVVDAGDQAVVVTLSSQLSGTYQGACIAAEDFPGQIFVVDSLSAAIGNGILVEYALRLADQGLEAAEIARKLTVQRENIRLVALIDTLEYLKRGGRVSKTVAFAGELLSIKPIIALQEGRVEVIGKARGTRQGQLNLDKQIVAAGQIDRSMPHLAGYVGLSQEPLEHYLQTTAQWPADSNRAAIGSTIGTHVGPGAVAVAFFTKV